MSITVSQARIDLENAHQTYIKCDHKDVATAKENLENARHEYWNACANFCTKLEFLVDLAEVHENLITQGLWV